MLHSGSENNGITPGDSDGHSNDRRISKRFPLRLEVTYRRIESKSVSPWTTSQSLNISSAGMLFATSETFLTGQRIEAFIAWPARLEQRVPLKLVIRGPIVRSAGENTAIRFEKYEFKIRTAAGSLPESLEQ